MSASHTPLSPAETQKLLHKQAVDLHTKQNYAGAALRYEALLQSDPRNWEALYNYGLCLQEMGQIARAKLAYQEAVLVRPQFADAHNNLGNLHQNLREYTEAEAAYTRALKFAPTHFEATYNLGLVLQRLNRQAESVVPLQHAIAQNPKNEAVWEALFNAHVALKDYASAIATFTAWHAANPTLGVSQILAGMLVARHSADANLEAAIVEALVVRPAADVNPLPNSSAGTPSELLGMMQYFNLPLATTRQCYQAYANAVGNKRKQGLQLPRRSQTVGDKRLRIGYVSPDFRGHVMGKLMLNVIANHDKAQFQIYLFGLNDPKFNDDVTQQFVEQVEAVVNLHAASTLEAAKLIADCDLDLLIDLGGHTAGARPALYAHKPARVIATHLGYHGCIGLPEVDYKITDAYCDTEESAKGQIEALLPIEGCVFPFVPNPHEPIAPTHSRAELGLEGKFVFATFVNLIKLSPSCLQTWKQILDAVPNSVLAFSLIREGDQASVERIMNAVGIAIDRVVFIPATKDAAELRARYKLVDAALDTFPYAGGDTTLAALDMNIPVVTLCGDRHAQRTGYSILSNLGVTETIAHDASEFAALAIKLATDKAWHKKIVAKISVAKSASILCDITHHVAALESAYKKAITEKTKNLKHGTMNSYDFTRAFQQAVRLHQSGETSRAYEGYQALLLEQPEYAPLNYLAGVLARDTGYTADAITLLGRAASYNVTDTEVRLALGNLYLAQKQPAEAKRAFEEVLAISAAHSGALNGLGLAATQSHEYTEAIDYLRRGHLAKPQDAGIVTNLGIAYHRNRQFREAAHTYSQALVLAPKNTDAAFNFGALLNQIEQTAPAEEMYRKVLSIDANHEMAFWQLREMLLRAGQVEDWLKLTSEFTKPTQERRKLNLRQQWARCESLRFLGKSAEEQAAFRTVAAELSITSDHVLAEEILSEMLYAMLFIDLDGAEELALYTRYNEAMIALYPQFDASPATQTPAKLKIGYVSGDLCDHVMGKMMFEVLSRHDISRVEIFCYSLAPKPDAWTEKIAAQSHYFKIIYGLDAYNAAKLIEADSIDVLVDLSTHTRHANPAIFAYKPAKVQMTHIGSAGALGLATVDYKLTDSFADLSSNQEFLLEKLLPITGNIFPIRALEAAPYPTITRAGLRLTEKSIVLGAFVQIQKLSPRCLALWKQILKRVPTAVLAFSPLVAEMQKYYLALTKEAGIAEDRVVFVPANADEKLNLARYQLVDIVLDTMPYSGVNGTIEALSMGVPVITMVGKRHGERTTFAILKHAGLGEFIAESGNDYVELAVKYAGDKTLRNAARLKIKEAMTTSSLVDANANVVALENAYFRAFSEVAERKPPLTKSAITNGGESPLLEKPTKKKSPKSPK
jgi:protein O-GlcNAc transferase